MGGAELRCDMPARIILVVGDQVREVAAGYHEMRPGSDGLCCRATVRAAGVAFGVDDVYSWCDAGLRLRRRVTVSVPGAPPEPVPPGAAAPDAAPDEPAVAGFASSFAWQPGPAVTGTTVAEPLWFLPGCVYGRNRHAPAGAIAATIGQDPVLVREDRLALPLAARYDRDSGVLVGLFHQCATGQTVEADDFLPVLVSEQLGVGSFGDLSADHLGFSFPGSEGMVSYPPMWAAGIGNSQADSPVNPFSFPADYQPQGWARRYHPVRDGFAHDYQLITVVAGAASFTDFVRTAWRTAWSLAAPRPRYVDTAAVERVSVELLAASVITDPEPGDREPDGREPDGRQAGHLEHDDLAPPAREARDPEHNDLASPAREAGDPAAPVPAGPAPPPTGIPTWIDVFTGRPGRLQDTFSAGFVGRNLEVAQVLLQAAEEHGQPGWERLGRAITDFWVRRSGDGLCHTEWDRRQRAWTDTDHNQRTWTDAGPAAGVVYLRDQSEARTAVLRTVAWLRSRSRDQPEWLAWCLGYARWLTGHLNADGSLCRSYRLDGTPADTSVNDGIHAAGFLARLCSVTGDPAWLAVAERVGDFYWSAFHASGTFVGGTLDNPNCCDREAASLALDAYLALHEAGGGQHWLTRARLAADFCESWIIGWDIPMTAADQREDRFFGRSVSPAGLALITLGFSAVDTYLSGHVGDFLRLAELTGDDHYTEVAQLLLHNTKQMVQIAAEYGYAAPGYQIEHWAIGRGRGYGLNSGWLPWVSTSHVRGIWAARDHGVPA
jgi:hypothetical protein